jgi:oxygen-independent coproporphyrinogen-3 oxidase
MLGLYLHVPFCSSICNYCNFNRGLFESGLKDRYVAALEQEILQAGAGEPADTIYFGGGTPSLLEPSEVARLIEGCHRAFAITGDVEVTLETNPETSTPPRMAGFRAAGVNGVSFGVQSFKDTELKRSTPALCLACPAGRGGGARGGFDNISLDLMMWLPQQTRADWQVCVDALIDAGPEHSSLYLLELYPNAPLRRRHGAPGGRSRRTTMRPRCISAAWRGSRRPAIASTRSRTSLAPGSSRGTT